MEFIPFSRIALHFRKLHQAVDQGTAIVSPCFTREFRYLRAKGQSRCIRAEVSQDERGFSTLASMTSHAPEKR
jgi:hypothetical protein